MLKKNWYYILLLSIAVVFGAAYGVFLALSDDLPQIRSMEDYNPSAITRIYSADGVLLGEWFKEKREPVSLDKMPDMLITALLTTEDRNFYSHNGVDLKGIFRAFLKNIVTGKMTEGASTITQQLSRTLFLTPEKSLNRKIREALLSIQLERRYTKREILTFYLNQVYFGSRAYGVEAAARNYFGKSVSDLSVAQCALLVGVLKGPSIYSPYADMKRAVERRNVVLKQLRITGNITQEVYEKAVNEPIIFPEKRGVMLKAPYFLDFIRPQLEELFGDAALYNGGLEIYTTLNYALQQKAEEALAKDVEQLYERLKNKKIDRAPNGALVCLHNNTGKILAMVGGTDYHESKFNRASSAKRQPGSSFKSLVFAYALEKGIDQDKILSDTPVVYKGGKKGKDWRPQNFSKTYMGEMTLRKALTHSKNIPSVRLLEELGVDETKSFIRKMGIDINPNAGLSLVLGSSETDLLSITSAYSIFPNKGNRCVPFGIERVKNADGAVIYEAALKRENVVSRENAAIMTNILEGVINEGTGKAALSINRPLGGKTGTTNDYRDALFIGFSPSISTGVWVGCDAPTPMGRGETGAGAALPAWIDFMDFAVKQMPVQFFDIPDTVRIAYMNPVTGELSPDAGKGGVKVYLHQNKNVEY